MNYKLYNPRTFEKYGVKSYFFYRDTEDNVDTDIIVSRETAVYLKLAMSMNFALEEIDAPVNYPKK